MKAFFAKCVSNVLLAGGLLFVPALSWGQTEGDFQTNALTVTFASPVGWQRYDGTAWNDAGAAPNSTDGVIVIRGGQMAAVTEDVTLDQLVIENGGTFWLNTNGVTFTLNDGEGADLEIRAGGTFVHGGPGAGVSAPGGDGEIVVRMEGRIRVDNNGGGQSDYYANNELIAFAARMIWESGAIFEWNIGLGFQTAGITYFPNVDANTVPVFRVSRNTSVGAGSNVTINGVFEASDNVAVIWQNAGRKVFRNGIRGGGTVTQATGSGQFLINGTAELGGGALELDGNGLQIAPGSVTRMISSKVVNARGTAGMSVPGTLDASIFTLSGTARYAMGVSSTLITANALGVDGSIGFIDYSLGSTKFIFNGRDPQITGEKMPTAVDALTVNNDRGVTLSRSTSVKGNLLFTAGKLYTGTNTVTLAAEATVSGEESDRYLVGQLQVTRRVNNDSGFGGIGVNIELDGNDPTDITVLRTSGLAGRRFSERKENIDRTWRITPGVQSATNRPITFSWLAADDNPDKVDLTSAQLWGLDGTGSWVPIGSPENVKDTRSITLSTDQLAGFTDFTVFSTFESLPVTLLAFNGRRQGNAVVLNWETASELDNAGFEVQRSADLKQFVRIGYVPATQRPQSVNRYGFTDENCVQDRYYRLKQLDHDGQYHLSKPIFVRGEESVTQEGLLLYPNPTNGDVHLALPDVGEARLTLSANGVVLADFLAFSPEEAQEQLSRKLNRLAAGLYLLRTRQGGQLYHNKLVKQ